jgi:hypothetical protein
MVFAAVFTANFFNGLNTSAWTGWVFFAIFIGDVLVWIYTVNHDVHNNLPSFFLSSCYTGCLQYHFSWVVRYPDMGQQHLLVRISILLAISPADNPSRSATPIPLQVVQICVLPGRCRHSAIHLQERSVQRSYSGSSRPWTWNPQCPETTSTGLYGISDANTNGECCVVASAPDGLSLSKQNRYVNRNPLSPSWIRFLNGGKWSRYAPHAKSSLRKAAELSKPLQRARVWCPSKRNHQPRIICSTEFPQPAEKRVKRKGYGTMKTFFFCTPSSGPHNPAAPSLYFYSNFAVHSPFALFLLPTFRHLNYYF